VCLCTAHRGRKGGDGEHSVRHSRHARMRGVCVCARMYVFMYVLACVHVGAFIEQNLGERHVFVMGSTRAQF